MIWSVVSKEEMSGFGTSPVFRFYREVLGKENVKLAVVDESDPLDFIEANDIVLLRTASKSLIDTIKSKKIISTAENFDLYQLTSNKEKLAEILNKFGILVPRQYQIDEVVDGHTYFVKPMFGSDSKGISEMSVCYTRQDVLRQVNYIENNMNQRAVIEDFIEGVDCTCSVIISYGSFVETHAIDVECDETGTIQTWQCKLDTNEYCSPVKEEYLSLVRNTALRVCACLSVQHHARIDFRRSKTGDLYVIDVNLIPGLGLFDHFAKSIMLNDKVSYWHVMNKVVRCASI